MEIFIWHNRFSLKTLTSESLQRAVHHANTVDLRVELECQEENIRKMKRAEHFYWESIRCALRCLVMRLTGEQQRTWEPRKECIQKKTPSEKESLKNCVLYGSPECPLELLVQQLSHKVHSKDFLSLVKSCRCTTRNHKWTREAN